MPAQHKRRGKVARERRRQAASIRNRIVLVHFPAEHERRDPYRPGFLVLEAELEVAQSV